METKLDSLRRNIREKVVHSMDFSRDVSDEEIFELIDNELIGELKNLAISVGDRKKLREQIFHSIRKLDILQQLVDDSSVTEIMINGTDNIFIEREGIICKYDGSFESKEKLEDVVQQIVAACNRVVNEELSFKKLNWNSYQT